MTEQDLQQRVQAFVRTFGLLNQTTTPCGLALATSHAHALQVLGEQSPLTLEAVAVQLGLEKSTTSRLISNLVDRGWVERTQNPGNRRELHLVLTESGGRALAGILKTSGAKYAGILRRIPAEKQTQVLEALDLLTAAARKE